MRHVLTMAVGAGMALRTHQYRLRPEPGAQLLFSSDGLHGVVDAETITSILDRPTSLESKCHNLIDAALRAGGPDNVTVVLLLVT